MADKTASREPAGPALKRTTPVAPTTAEPEAPNRLDPALLLDPVDPALVTEEAPSVSLGGGAVPPLDHTVEVSLDSAELGSIRPDLSTSVDGLAPSTERSGIEDSLAFGGLAPRAGITDALDGIGGTAVSVKPLFEIDSTLAETDTVNRERTDAEGNLVSASYADRLKTTNADGSTTTTEISGATKPDGETLATITSRTTMPDGSSSLTQTWLEYDSSGNLKPGSGETDVTTAVSHKEDEKPNDEEADEEEYADGTESGATVYVDDRTMDRVMAEQGAAGQPSGTGDDIVDTSAPLTNLNDPDHIANYAEDHVVVSVDTSGPPPATGAGPDYDPDWQGPEVLPTEGGGSGVNPIADSDADGFGSAPESEPHGDTFAEEETEPLAPAE